MDTGQNLLTLLEESRNSGELVVGLHIFSGDKEIGRAIYFNNELVQSGELTFELRRALQDYIRSESKKFDGIRVFDFSFKQGELEYQVIGELLESAPELFVFGAGHVGQAVAAIGAVIGHKVIVIDDRGEFLTRERFPNKSIELREESYSEINSRINISSNSAVVIVTRGHQYDEACLEQIIERRTRYIGMIGSKRRVLSIFNRLAAKGVSRVSLDRVHAPIGLKIGAVSPQEIAVSIIAEIISIMNGSNFKQAPERRR